MTRDVDEWAKGKLKDLVEKRITQMFGSILDYVQTAVDSKYRYGVLRSKILKEGNETIRTLKSELDRYYKVEYVRIGEDVIKIKDGGGR